MGLASAEPYCARYVASTLTPDWIRAAVVSNRKNVCESTPGKSRRKELISSCCFMLVLLSALLLAWCGLHAKAHRGYRILTVSNSTAYDSPIVMSEPNRENIGANNLAIRCVLEQQGSAMQVRIKTLRCDDLLLPILEPKSFAVTVVDRRGDAIVAQRSSSGRIVPEVGHAGVLTGEIDYCFGASNARHIRDVAVVRVRFGTREVYVPVREHRGAFPLWESSWMALAR